MHPVHLFEAVAPTQNRRQTRRAPEGVVEHRYPPHVDGSRERCATRFPPLVVRGPLGAVRRVWCAVLGAAVLCPPARGGRPPPYHHRSGACGGGRPFIKYCAPFGLPRGRARCCFTWGGGARASVWGGAVGWWGVCRPPLVRCPCGVASGAAVCAPSSCSLSTGNTAAPRPRRPLATYGILRGEAPPRHAAGLFSSTPLVLSIFQRAGKYAIL